MVASKHLGLVHRLLKSAACRSLICQDLRNVFADTIGCCETSLRVTRTDYSPIQYALFSKPSPEGCVIHFPLSSKLSREHVKEVTLCYIPSVPVSSSV